MPVTLQLSFLYAVAFGGFVAFSVYLPTYLGTAYGLERGDAALRTAGFVVLAVAMRPVGGWLSDRFHPIAVLIGRLRGRSPLLAVVAALELPLIPVGTVAFLGHRGRARRRHRCGASRSSHGWSQPERVGAVTGVVGAAGGLGGFFPPLVMGLVYSALGDYTLGYVLLAIIAAAAGALTTTAVRRRVEKRATA